MIPDFDSRGWLPFELPSSLVKNHSPYMTTMAEIVARYGFSPQRRTLIYKLLQYRGALYQQNLKIGYQILAGSFVDDCERVRGRPPKDIDVLTFLVPTYEMRENRELRRKGVHFLNSQMQGVVAKRKFNLDAHLAVFGWTPLEPFFNSLVKRSMMFSTDRSGTHTKGTLAVGLHPARDREAIRALQQANTKE